MLRYVIYITVLTNLKIFSFAWDKDTRCPSICTCRLEHLSETAIYRFMQADAKPTSGEVNSAETNDVLFEDNFENELLEEKTIVRSTTCILQTETDPTELIESIPKDIETLTLIQGYKSGNKSIKFSNLWEFTNLISIELIGANLLNKVTDSLLICEIDKPFTNIKYLNFERIHIKNSKTQIQKFVNEINTDVTFEYVQRFNGDMHPITMVQKDTNEEIVSFEKFKKQQKYNEVPLFIGFKNLLLLRISNCELNNVHWEMFDGLQNLQILILEKNNLRFIPPFAFYGTPSLKTLSLAHNNLLDIQITDLAGLLELEYLDLTYNNFSQLSELSLPPFPKLKLANFANNPISVIFPNTFEVMNTTNSLIIGSNDMPLQLITNSLLGLNLLKVMMLNNLNIKVLRRDLLVGMPILNELYLSGNVSEIEYDAFLEVYQLKKLSLSNCQITNISMDAFIGLEKLFFLDLSKNKLETLQPGVFDPLINIKELYLNGNNFHVLPRDIFSFIHPKLLRLNNNPWHCSCDMSEWKPMIVNKIKQKIIKNCEVSFKGTCTPDNKIMFKYVYDNRVAPKCVMPKLFVNWSVFHLMRRQLHCADYKPRIRKNYSLRRVNLSYLQPDTTTTNNNSLSIQENKINFDKQVENENNIQQNKINSEEHSDILNNDVAYQKLGLQYNFSSYRLNKSDILHPIENVQILQNNLKNDISPNFNTPAPVAHRRLRIRKYRKKLRKPSSIP